MMNQKNLKILKIRLESDFELKEASSGEEALEALKTFSPAVILLDIMMSGIDGYEVTRQIRKNPDFALTKIILVSGKAMIDDKLEGYHCGAEDYITKPFNGEELKAKLNTYVKMYQLESELKRINVSLEEEINIRTQQLLESERQAFIGRNACEIVHNLKNPMAVIKFYLSTLQEEFPNHPNIPKVDKAADKILLFIKDILTSNINLNPEPTSQDLNKVVLEELDFLKIGNTFKKGILPDPQLNSTKKVTIAESHAHQIIGNILKNATDALQGTADGKVTVTTQDLDGFQVIHISDNGPGISPENLPKIFQSQFTTKKGENGGPIGNGLGLPYCKKMIESYGGKIDVKSTLSKGTEVILYFPAA